ncbi:hypothetical protein BC940DRAFT_310802 [Gongronella butleri]|nr:hypothetical protein BC940DRAFT_310802 [Gongronella butleri]
MTLWFQGSIPEAVASVNAKQCLFIVFLQDESPRSTQLQEALDTPQVQQAMQPHVCLQLAHASDNATLFGQIYPVQRVPIVYIIHQGTIKGAAIETTAPDDIVAAIDRVAPVSDASNASVVPPAAPAAASEAPAPSQPASTSLTSPLASSTTPPSETMDDDKRAKLKKKMEDARAQRAQAEKEDAKRRELKRREEGKQAQLTKDHLESEQNKRHFAKIRSEKQADEAQRRKIKEQIARDREEQKKQLARDRENQKKQRTLHQPDTPTPMTNQAASRSYDECHLNIRQTDGSNLRQKFKSVDTLEQVRNWIDANRTDGDQPFKLLAQFPTRHFTVGEESHSLQALDLVPSSTIIMKEIRNVASAYQQGGGAAGYTGTLLNYTYSAGSLVYNTVAGIVGGVLGAVTASAAPQGSSTVGGNGNDATTDASPADRIPSRQIHGISQLRHDNDDQRNTYNGNSLNQE